METHGSLVSCPFCHVLRVCETKHLFPQPIPNLSRYCPCRCMSLWMRRSCESANRKTCSTHHNKYVTVVLSLFLLEHSSFYHSLATIFADQDCNVAGIEKQQRDRHPLCLYCFCRSSDAVKPTTLLPVHSTPVSSKLMTR